MVQSLLIISILMLIGNSLIGSDFNTFFTENRLRLNYTVTGNSDTLFISESELIREFVWSGSKINLLDTFDYGHFKIEVIDQSTNQLMYSRAYNNLFHEWQTTATAKHRERSFRESILLPEPTYKAYIKILARDKQLVYSEVFSMLFVPSKDAMYAAKTNSAYGLIYGKGIPSKRLDITFVSEGYTNDQRNKFLDDVERFKEYLFGWEPYKEMMDLINIHAVFVPSNEEGIDIPADSIYRNTAFDVTFSTFGIDRYMSLPDISRVYDHLSGIPVDQLVVLANSDKYGGGGILNQYNLFTADTKWAEYLFLHELGHGFAGLADEYIASDETFNDLVNPDMEPIEPNITTLKDFQAKWQDMVHDSIPIPTPDIPSFDDVVGAFEGASYRLKGIYRPMRNCAMRSSTKREFCPVCKRSILQMIRFYSE